jgi:putative membrane protein
LREFLYLWLISAAAFVVTVALVPGIDVDWQPGIYLFSALIIGLVNAILKPIARWLSLPLMAITFGLFAFVVNGLMLLIVAWILDPLDIDGLVPAMVGAVVLTIVTWFFDWFLGRFRVVRARD